MFGKISFWLFLLLLLSAPAGWYLADKNMERKAVVQAELERLAEIARIEAARLAMEKLRAEVKQNRDSAVGTPMESVILKNNKKPLSKVTIKAFHDDGIAFNSETGSARVQWADLPDELVKKYCDPVTAKDAEGKAEKDAASLVEMQSLGQEVQVSFEREIIESENTFGMRGSVVKVLIVSKQGSQDGGGKKIFILNMAKSAFEQNPIQRLHVYPVGRLIIFYKKEKGNVVLGNDKIPVFASTADQAFQLAKLDGISLKDLAKSKL